jgi:mannose-6-phosphate isomerase-like protein (cupin superfamily)
MADIQDSHKRLTVSNALAELASQDQPFKKLFEHGTLEVEIYKPDQVDLQTPHTRDEIYVIASGSGIFINGEARHSVEVGEVLFVPAGVEHRFVDFTEDFSTWVLFYGPEGGEKTLES